MRRKFSTFLIILIHLYLAPCVRTLNVVKEKGYGFIEDPAYDQEKCVSTPIKLGLQERHPFALSLRNSCRPPETVEMNEHGEKVRQKRSPIAVGVAIVAFVSSAVVGAFTAWNYICDWSRAAHQSAELKKLEEILNLAHSNSNLTFQLIKEDRDEHNDEYFEQIRIAIFQPGQVENILSFFQINKEKLIKEMGFKNNIGNGVLRKMEHNLFCGKNSNNYVLEICAWTNPTRVYGNVALIAPVGNFINNGELYSYYDTPRLAVFTDTNGTLSANGCEILGKQWSCRLATKGCNIGSYKSCTPTLVHTPDHVYTLEIADMTFVATTVTHYSLYENGSTTAHKTLDVPQSGHFLFTAPDDSFVQIGSRRFAGRHNVHNMIQLHVNESMNDLSHAQLRELKENLAKEGVALNELEEMRLHDSVGFGGGIYDTVTHFVREHWLISAVIGIPLLLAAVVLVIAILKWAYRKVKCNKKKKNNINLNFHVA